MGGSDARLYNGSMTSSSRILFNTSISTQRSPSRTSMRSFPSLSRSPKLHISGANLPLAASSPSNQCRL